jgi:hypothetical protein
MLSKLESEHLIFFFLNLKIIKFHVLNVIDFRYLGACKCYNMISAWAGIRVMRAGYSQLSSFFDVIQRLRITDVYEEL